MKKLVYVFASCLSLQLSAQPVIHHMEDQSIGTHVAYLNCNAMPAGPSGASQTWNFATLAASDSFIFDVATPPTPSLFPAANIGLKYDSAWTFVNKTAGKSYYVGSVDSHSYAMGSIYAYPNTYQFATRPVNYNYKDSDIYTVFQAAPDTLTGTGKITFLADGYGTLSLPTGTYTNVMRIKEVVTEDDTFHTNPAFTYSQRTIIYLWYDDLHASALLSQDSTWFYSASENDSSFSGMYLVTETLDVPGMQGTQPANASACFKNDKLVVNGDLEEGHKYILYMVNEAGQKIYSTDFTAVAGGNEFSVDRYLSSGIYFVVLKEADKPMPIGLKVIR
jgi:hypothetical protein